MRFTTSPVALALIAALSSTHTLAEEVTQNDSADVERIEVTGSRIARINTQTPSPVVSIGSEAIKSSGILNANELLTQLPQFAMGFDSSQGNSSFGNAGLNLVNLRNLGTDRTLVLVNGRRVVQSTYDNGFMATDTGYIPVDLIDRIDVLTGGAAATYGADAVAGVVNFIMKKEYEGTRVSAQYGESDLGDGEAASFTITTGHNFNNDKGNVVFSLDYFDEKGASLMNRPGSGEQTSWLNNPDNTSDPDDGIPNKIAGYNLAWPDYNVHGQMMGVYDADTGNTNFYNVTGNESVYMYNWDDWRSPFYLQESDNATGWHINRYNKVNSPYERATFYTLVNYELTDDIHFSADFRYTKVESQNQISSEFNYWSGWLNDGDFDASIARPQHIQDLLAQDSGYFVTSIGLNELGPRTSDVERDLLAFTSTLTGEFSNGWSWDLYVSSGKTNHDTVLSNYTNKYRFSDGHDSVTNDDGQYCGVDVFDCPSSHPLVSMSQEALDYITLDPFGSQITTEQSTFSASTSGDLMDLPAGGLLFAAGIDIRRESIDMEVDETWQSGIADTEKHPWKAAKTIQEMFLEVEAPIISDVFLIDELLLSAAGRISSYTYAGTHKTWKLGATWSIIDGLAMRSTLAHTIRAPQLSEQFSAVRTGFSSGKLDPCDQVQIMNTPAEHKAQVIANCQAWGIDDPENFDSLARVNAGVDVTTTGNSYLKPESGDTLTAGIVYTPSFVDNLSFTVDYYDIELEDAMGSAGIQNTLDKCSKEEDINNSVYCPLVTRGSDGNIVDVLNTTVNQAYVHIKGIDIEVSYLQGLDKFGEIDFAFNVTKLLDSTYRDSDEDSIHDVTGIGYRNVELKARLVTTYTYEDLEVYWTTNYADGFQVSEYGTYDLYDKPFAPHSIMHDARIAYDVNDNTNVYFGISNVFDKNYFNHPETSYGRAQYDSMGRYFYGGFSYEF
ncbi:TonB-dependent receptor plug domain-containing protein [Litorilituus sediminis]|uniref:TonB-dependent receptor n=1 Tax=Litorilituus sediminis TaxID=718192 RepID=A0A4P6P725_9GAMM|nr:TonB-dependent receptor [Litorilituus sediminis]QBG37353.1 hypothetical protein EMK97_17210 [Litorilituus sediminis]